ncbi:MULTISPECIES: helix-turn-helix domain-containing protein [Thermomonosporaceae]|uniref:helix-turn-helix domain-containing protein n=1 Tax=Thermomonosporaceae TaxID=2012 RepID=UPI00255AFC51|nr:MULTISPECIES: helix-turn-helix domain-containing protein [Thermomonosporaceae]MDL4774696.1 helix-turn-helix domain-containing protein [Actinomadura xylanilytica]
MLRVHFTGEDLVRTRVAETPDPLWETVLSLHMLRARYGTAVFGEWRLRVRAELRRTGLSEPVKELLFPLTPDAAYFPDFMTPAEGLLGLDEGIAAVLDTPARSLRVQIGRLRFTDGVPPAMRALAGGDRPVLDELGDALRAYYAVALEPSWPDIRERADVDLAARSVERRTGGVGALLGGFWPMMRWRPPVLEMRHPLDRDLYLDGRGLVLVPSRFCWHRPVPIADPGLPPTIVYPMRLMPDSVGAAGGSMTRLLGATRAEVLRRTGGGRTTGELARTVGVSAATASCHAAVLREAGLITSRRSANSMVHALTALGAALVGEERRTLTDGSHRSPG